MAAAADSKSAVREYVRVRVPLLAPASALKSYGWQAKCYGRTKKRLEGCPSGRWCNLGKVVWAQVHRGFESPPLRQYLFHDTILNYHLNVVFAAHYGAKYGIICANLVEVAG